MQLLYDQLPNFLDKEVLSVWIPHVSLQTERMSTSVSMKITSPFKEVLLILKGALAQMHDSKGEACPFQQVDHHACKIKIMISLVVWTESTTDA